MTPDLIVQNQREHEASVMEFVITNCLPENITECTTADMGYSYTLYWDFSIDVNVIIELRPSWGKSSVARLTVVILGTGYSPYIPSLPDSFVAVLNSYLYTVIHD